MTTPKDPLATEPSHVPTDPTNDYSTCSGPRCFACGGYHCCVNHAIVCLQLRIRTLETAMRAIHRSADDPAAVRSAVDLAMLLASKGGR